MGKVIVICCDLITNEEYYIDVIRTDSHWTSVLIWTCIDAVQVFGKNIEQAGWCGSWLSCSKGAGVSIVIGLSKQVSHAC